MCPAAVRAAGAGGVRRPDRAGVRYRPAPAGCDPAAAEGCGGAARGGGRASRRGRRRPPRPEDVEVVNAASAAASLWPQLSWAAPEMPGCELRMDPSACTLALAEIAHCAVRLLGGDQRLLLRACQAPGCVLFFVANRPTREWCSAACGNRARVARHYARQSAAARQGLKGR
ncbi:CGNR zinc finger domain-containing protein [Streptomyces sp. NPDC046931]|uniref:CGNR zinc finger domain-containing protein n=1 Tax=Streptomyces sp. NPDC046931 TaxID=3154806 RepID=UPI0033C6B097